MLESCWRGDGGASAYECWDRAWGDRRPVRVVVVAARDGSRGAGDGWDVGDRSPGLQSWLGSVVGGEPGAWRTSTDFRLEGRSGLMLAKCRPRRNGRCREGAGEDGLA